VFWRRHTAKFASGNLRKCFAECFGVGARQKLNKKCFAECFAVDARQNLTASHHRYLGKKNYRVLVFAERLALGKHLSCGALFFAERLALGKASFAERIILPSAALGKILICRALRYFALGKVPGTRRSIDFQ